MRDFKTHKPFEKKNASVRNSGVIQISQPQNTKTEMTEIKEIGGPEGPEPTRYGDWEKGGRCTDF